MVSGGGKPRADGQISGLAGEFFVAAELLKRGLQTSVTFGNAKAIDLLAHHPDTSRNFTVQVKSLRQHNWFPFKYLDVDPQHVYVFVVLNKPGQDVEYFVVPGCEFIENPAQFGKGLDDPKFPGVNWSALKGFKDNWGIFAEPA